MQVLVWAAVLVSSLLMESTLLDRMKLMGVKPDLLLVAVVLFALARGARPAARLGFVFGLSEDLLIGKYIGLNALSKASIGYLVGLGENRLYKDNPLIPVAGLFTGTIVYEVIYLVLGGLGGMHTEPEGFLRVVLPAAMYNSLVALILYPRFRRQVSGAWLRVPGNPDPRRLRR